MADIIIPTQENWGLLRRFVDQGDGTFAEKVLSNEPAFKNPWQANSLGLAVTTSTAIPLMAAPADGTTANFCDSIQFINTSVLVSTVVTLLDGANIVWTGFLPANAVGLQIIPQNYTFRSPIKAVGALSLKLATSGASVYWSAQGHVGAVSIP